jgi:hypothetical protein
LSEEGYNHREEVAGTPRSQVNVTLVSVPVEKTGRGRDTPKQIQKPKSLHNHPNERPLAENEEDAAEEADCPPDLLFAREEGDGLLRTDDEREAGDEEDLF